MNPKINEVTIGGDFTETAFKISPLFKSVTFSYKLPFKAVYKLMVGDNIIYLHFINGNIIRVIAYKPLNIVHEQKYKWGHLHVSSDNAYVYDYDYNRAKVLLAYNSICMIPYVIIQICVFVLTLTKLLSPTFMKHIAETSMPYKVVLSLVILVIVIATIRFLISKQERQRSFNKYIVDMFTIILMIAIQISSLEMDIIYSPKYLLFIVMYVLLTVPVVNNEYALQRLNQIQ